MTVPIRVVFSGLNLVVAKKDAAAIAAMAHTGDPEHYPMLIVPKDQLVSTTTHTPEIKALSDHILPGWLPAGDWRAFEISGYDLEFKEADQTTSVSVEPPTARAGCPYGNWDWEDLGWHVQFRRSNPTGTFETDWEKSTSVAMYTKLPSGTLVGAPPIDLPPKGLKIYEFAGGKQAFTDACLWKSGSSSGQLTINALPRVGVDQKSFVLKPSGTEPIVGYIFNHPKKPRTVKPGWHLTVVHEVFAKYEVAQVPIFNEERCKKLGALSSSQSKTGTGEGGCGSAKVVATFDLPMGSTGSVTVQTSGCGEETTGCGQGSGHSAATLGSGHAHGGPEMGPIGEEYCAEGLVFDI